MLVFLACIDGVNLSFINLKSSNGKAGSGLYLEKEAKFNYQYDVARFAAYVKEKQLVKLNITLDKLLPNDLESLKLLYG